MELTRSEVATEPQSAKRRLRSAIAAPSAASLNQLCFSAVVDQSRVVEDDFRDRSAAS